MVIRIVAICMCWLLHGSIAATAGAALSDAEVENLRTFTKLYGYVRWFHPSDAAAETDWERFAVEGVAAVRRAEDRAALAAALNNLFSPIASTVTIYDSELSTPQRFFTRPDVYEAPVVAWQHSGVATGSNSMYRSVRTNRESTMTQAFAAFTQVIDAKSYRGRRIRLRGAVRVHVQGEGNTGGLWLRVDRPDGRQGFFDNMQDRPITAPEWATYEITGRVDDDAQSLAFGGLLIGVGRLHVDAIELSVSDEHDSWQQVLVYNGTFEVDDEAPIGWFTGRREYAFELDKVDPYEGERSLLVRSDALSVPGAIFDYVPLAGTAVDKPIGAGLRAHIPIAIADTRERISDNPDPGDVNGSEQAAGRAEWTTSDENVRFAGIVIAWNLLQHFYPYFDVIGTDWDNVLTATLLDAGDDASIEDYIKTLSLMVSELEDGHGAVFAEPVERPARPPFRLRWIEDKVVVTHTAIPEVIRPGDVVLEIDGRPAVEIVDKELKYVSGTMRWKRYKVVAGLGRGAADSSVSLTIDRAGDRIDVEVMRGDAPLQMNGLDSIQKVDGDVWYVDLTRASKADIFNMIDEIAASPGVIFDMRGYPDGNHDILSHLVDESVRSAIWNVAQVVYPDREGVVRWDRSGRWLMPPREPRIRGTVVFMTDASAISYAESIMGIVEHYRLGEIVGEATAGANGNVNSVNLPGGVTVVWTGMKVLKHDGSQHHNVGIHPTIPVSRTIETVRSGDDEHLEAALRYIAASRADHTPRN